MNYLKFFEEIRENLKNRNQDVTDGKMMHAPAIKIKSGNFAFFYKDQMIFKLGEKFDTENIDGIEQFSPFKHKSPMKNWYLIGSDYYNLWPEFAEKSLNYIRTEKK